MDTKLKQICIPKTNLVFLVLKAFFKHPSLRFSIFKFLCGECVIESRFLSMRLGEDGIANDT